MMFKGNAAHPTQSDLQASMKELGVTDWNGGTSGKNVTYYFTVPADKVDRGIQFWADAARSPFLDPGELSTEKDVVVNEILGYLSDRAISSVRRWRRPCSGSIRGART